MNIIDFHHRVYDSMCPTRESRRAVKVIHSSVVDLPEEWINGFWLSRGVAVTVEAWACNCVGSYHARILVPKNWLSI